MLLIIKIADNKRANCWIMCHVYKKMSCKFWNFPEAPFLPSRFNRLLNERVANVIRHDISHFTHLLDDFRIFDYKFDPLVIGQLVSHAPVHFRQVLGQDVFVQTLVVVTVKEQFVSHIGVEQRFEDREDRVKDPRLMKDVYRVYLDGKRGHH